MKKQGLFRAATKSFSFGVRLAPKPFWSFGFFSIVAGLLPLATIGSFSILVNKIVAMTKVGGFRTMSLLGITELLLPYMLLLLLAYFLPYFANSMNSYFANLFQERFMTKFLYLFSKKQTELDAATLESSTHQNKIQQGNEWGQGSVITLIGRSFAVLADIASLLVTIVVLFATDARLGIIAAFASLPLYYIEQKYNKKLFRFRRLQTEQSRIIANRRFLFQSQYSLIELNMFGSSKKFSEEFRDLMNDQDNKIIEIAKAKNKIQVLFRIYSVVCNIFAAILIIQKGLAGVLPAGTLLFAFSAYNNFYSSIGSFLSDISVGQDAARYAHIWFDILETQPIISSKPDALKPAYELPPRIEFKNVSFKYADGDTYALKDINLVLEPSEKIAIVGLSGAGKTTLIKLLSRIYDPTDGVILVDNVPLPDINVKHWQKYLGIMFQNYGQYNVTVEESVALGRGGAVDDGKVDWALEMAGAKSFVDTLTNGKKQMLWKGFRGGTELSKGEHQRIAIARIFYRSALISILDEPTSSVDALTAEMIFSNLEEKMGDKTVVLISHNFSTVKESSNIIVLEHGTIIEQGTHEYLYQKGGRYAELYESQANAFAF